MQQVLSNLLIAHIELRGEDSLDVRQYVHERRVEKMVVPLEGEILEIRNIFKKVSEPYRNSMSFTFLQRVQCVLWCQGNYPILVN